MSFLTTTTAKKRKSKADRSKEMRESDLLKRIHDDLKEANETRSEWVEMAKSCENFRNGHQWEPDDEAILAEQKRPKVTFNLIRRVVDAIIGTEIQHRQKILFLPRKPNNVPAGGAADLATDSVDWAIELAKGPHERSQVFRDCAIRGIGCGSYRLDYEEDPDGRLVIDRTDSFEMSWDPAARKQNLEDIRWCSRKRLWRIDDAEEEFGKSITDMKMGDPDSIVPPFGPGSDSDSPTKVHNFGPNPFAPGAQKVTPGAPELQLKGMVEVIEYQWYEREKFYRVLEEPGDPPLPLDSSSDDSEQPDDSTSMSDMPDAAGPMSSSSPAGPGSSSAPQLGQSTDSSGPLPPPSPPGMSPPAGAPPQPGIPGMAGPGAAPPGAAAPAPPPGGPPPGPPPPPPDPATQQDKWTNLSLDEYDKVVKRLSALGMPPPQAVKMTRRKYKQAFVAGNTLLREDDMWMDGFSYLFMTWDWDSKDKIWYGLVRDLIDPQKLANKWCAQGIHHFNTGAKGTLFIERDAVEDPDNLPTNYAKPGAIVLLKPGALGAGRFQVQQPAPFPEAVSTMIQYAMQALQEIPGISIDAIGAGEGDAPGVAIQNRATQGLTILAPLFDALTRYRETEAKTVLRILKKFFLDGRLIRVGDPHQFEYKPLLAEQFSEDYDLVLDDAPRDPNQKRSVWETMGSIMPLIVRQNGDLPDVFKDFAPLPTSLITEWKKDSAEKAAAPPPPPKLDDDPRMIEAKIGLVNAQAELAMARAQSMTKDTGMELAKMAQDMTIDQRKMNLAEHQAHHEIAAEHGKNALDALASVKQLENPNFPGVRAG